MTAMRIATIETLAVFMRMRGRHIAAVFLFFLVAYGGGLTAAYYTQSYAIFQSGGASLPPPGHLPIDEAILKTPDGERLYAWWLKTPGAEKTILYFQPNRFNVSYHIPRLATFRELGVNGLIFDYRGYGKSSGRVKKEADIFTDGLTAWNYLIEEKGLNPEQIVLWGRSLGGAVAAEVGRLKPAAGLVLESTFYSLDAVARRRCWFLPISRLLAFPFENGLKVREIKAPIVIIHSVADKTIPFAHARRLFEAASNPKVLIRTTGSHLDSFDCPGGSFAIPPGNSDSRDRVLAALGAVFGL
jgi:fermentation-respiration switch protein FrsA (DUF1100 family)